MPCVASHHRVVDHDDDLARVQARADGLSGQLARHRVAVARHRRQTGAADPGHFFDVAVERHRYRHRHYLQSLVFEHLGDAELLVLGMLDLGPQLPATLAHPGIEFVDAAEAHLPRVDPDAPAAVLHVLLDDSLLPAGGDVAWATQKPLRGPVSGSYRECAHITAKRALTARPLPFKTLSTAVRMLS